MISGQGRTFWWGVSALAAVVILLVGWFAAISPQLSAADDAQTQTADLQTQNQLLRTKLSALEQQQPGPLRADLAAADAALPYEAALPALTRQLTEQAQQHDVTVDSIVIGAPAAANGVADAAATAGTPLAVPVTVTSTGVSANQRAFLESIQVQGPRLALITGSQLSPRGGDDGTTSGRSSMSLTMTVFVAPLDSAAQTQLEKLLGGGSS